jgi:hypothetical protein
VIDLWVIAGQITKILPSQVIPRTIHVGSLQFLVLLPHIVFVEPDEEILNDGAGDQVMFAPTEIVMNRLLELYMFVHLVCGRVGPGHGLRLASTIVRTVLEDGLSHGFAEGLHPPRL